MTYGRWSPPDPTANPADDSYHAHHMVRRRLSIHAKAIGLVAIGGILGSNLRFLLGAVSGEALLITMLVNGVGSFGLGLLLFDLRADDYLTRRTRYLIGTGFFASFTSYSTFIADIVASGSLIALAYIAVSYGAGFGGIIASRGLIDRFSANGVTPLLEGDE